MIKNLVERHPELACCEADITVCVKAIIHAYESKKKLLVCGNGGSCCDADHIVGELMKGFCRKRPLTTELEQWLDETDSTEAKFMAEQLQMPLRAINLGAHMGLSSAISNDINPELDFAQQVLGYADSGDIYIGLSTSGSSHNVVYGGVMAKALGAITIGFTGKNTCKMDELFDIVIHVPAVEVYKIQEYHLPIYHAICLTVENYFFKI